MFTWIGGYSWPGNLVTSCFSQAIIIGYIFFRLDFYPFLEKRPFMATRIDSADDLSVWLQTPLVASISQREADTGAKSLGALCKSAISQ